MNTSNRNASAKLPAIVLLALTGGSILLVGAGKLTSTSNDQERIARGKYLVAYGGCTDCHTPLKMTDQGPIPDASRFLSGHPESVQLPPPDLKPGPWFAATAGMTAWTGPWGITYAANLTPDSNTGLGIWTEEMFLQAMKTGKHMGQGRQILPPMPWQSLSQLTHDDLKSIYAYLRTIPPIQNHVPAPLDPTGRAISE